MKYFFQILFHICPFRPAASSFLVSTRNGTKETRATEITLLNRQPASRRAARTQAALNGLNKENSGLSGCLIRLLVESAHRFFRCTNHARTNSYQLYDQQQMRVEDTGAECGSVDSRRDVVRMRRPWVRGLFEAFCCLRQEKVEFRSKPHHDNRSLENRQFATRSFASFASMVKEGGATFRSTRNKNSSLQEYLS